MQRSSRVRMEHGTRSKEELWMSIEDNQKPSSLSEELKLQSRSFTEFQEVYCNFIIYFRLLVYMLSTLIIDRILSGFNFSL